MPDSLREVWTPRQELAKTEYRSQIEEHRDQLVDEAEGWLTGQSAAVDRLRARATSTGIEGAAVVTIHGEPGSGKRRVAQWIHRCSARSQRPLLVLDADEPGLVALLDGVIKQLTESDTGPGTLVLRDFDRAPGQAIERLFTVLDCQGIQLVCSVFLLTKIRPEQLRELSPLHAELLARTRNAMLSVPSLRYRGNDVADLARQFVDAAARRYNKSIRGVSANAVQKLVGHEFPGNVRELEAMIEQAVLRTSGDWVTAECIPGLGESSSVRATDDSELVIRLPGSSLREIEIEVLRLALGLAEGRIVRASELLGITRHALRRKLEKFGLNDLRAAPVELDDYY